MVLARFKIIFLVLAVATSGCTFKEYKDKSGQLGATEVVAGFSSVRANIIQPKCLVCHSGSAPKGGLDLTHFARLQPPLLVPGKPEQSILYTDCAAGIMPKNGARLSAGELKALHDWIQNGALESDEDPAKAKPSPPLKTLRGALDADFKSIKEAILQPKCLGCHSGAQPAAGLDLSNFTRFVPPLVVPGAPEQSLLYNMSFKGLMPKNQPRLADEELRALFDWIKAGAKDEKGRSAVRSPVSSPSPAPSPVGWFNSIQATIFNAKCISCHGGSEPPWGIDLSSYEKIIHSSSFPPLIVPGEPDKSDIYIACRNGEMPKNGPKLSDEELKALYDWIKKGAPGPTGLAQPMHKDEIPEEPGQDEVPGLGESENNVEIFPEPCDKVSGSEEPGFLDCPPE